MLNRNDILSKNVLKRELVSVPQWGGDVFVSEMSGAVRDAWEQSIIKRDKSNNVINPRAKLIIATVINEDGSPMFTDDDMVKISALSSMALDKICRVAQRLNGLEDSDVEDAKGNSEAGPSVDSTSD